MNILINNNRLSRQPIRTKKNNNIYSGLLSFLANEDSFLYVSASGYGISSLKTYGRLPPFLYKND